MSIPQTQPLHTLRLTRVFNAPRERVWRAWTDPEQLRLWWGPRGFTAPSIEMDLRPGGRYRIAMRPPEGEIFHLNGVFQEIVPPERLVYTFQWEKPGWDYPETLVTAEFRDLGGRTELVLIHERFPEEKMRNDHEGGWTGTLDRLAELLG